MEIRIADPDGNPVPVDQTGEIWLRGPTIFKEYFGLPDQTAAALVDGWFRTGDVGRVDEDGFLYVVDRLKDVIIRAGENIYAAEVEAALYEHPDVAEAAIVGVPDERLGEQVAAFVRLRPDAKADAAALRGARGEPARRFQGAVDRRDHARHPASQCGRQGAQARAARRTGRRVRGLAAVPSELTYEEHDHVGVITLDRPEARNALTFTTYAELEDAVRGTTARCLVVTGADPAFCSGDDVKQIMAGAGDQVAQGLRCGAPR